MPAAKTKSRGDDLLEGMHHKDLSEGVGRIMDVCGYYPRPVGLEQQRYLQVRMETGLELLHKAFLDPDLPKKEGKSMREASQLLADWSRAYGSIAKDERNMQPITAGEGPMGRMGKVMEYVSIGLNALDNNSNGNNGDSASFAAMSTERNATAAESMNAAVNAIRWAKVYGSEEIYRKYVWLNIDEEFRSLSEGKKLEMLLGNEESIGFSLLRKEGCSLHSA